MEIISASVALGDKNRSGFWCFNRFILKVFEQTFEIAVIRNAMTPIQWYRHPALLCTEPAPQESDEKKSFKWNVAYSLFRYCFNSLWPDDAIWRYGTRSILAQVMTCCLTAPSHHLNQCWLIIREVLWHWAGCIIIRRFKESDQLNEIENCSFEMASRSPRGQWLKLLIFSDGCANVEVEPG